MTESSSSLTLAQLVPLWQIHLKAQRLSPRSVKSYGEALWRLDAWLVAEDRSTEVAEISKRTLEAWMVALSETITRSGEPMKPSSVASYFRWAQQFFRWASAEGELGRDRQGRAYPSPMADMNPPRVPEIPVDAVDLVEYLALMQTTANSNRLEDRRDAAILSILYDTGIRLDELARLRVVDVDLEGQQLRVTGKGSKIRDVGIGATAMDMLSRYYRSRLVQPGAAEEEHLWLRRTSKGSGALRSDGVASMIERRARQAGIRHITPHQFRHGWASNMKKANIQHDELKAAGGWASDAMVERYGRATVRARAVETMKRLSPVDAAGRR